MLKNITFFIIVYIFPSLLLAEGSSFACKTSAVLTQAQGEKDLAQVQKKISTGK